jgi:DUF4097 and DUF4098 domain-containing protein YvlB
MKTTQSTLGGLLVLPLLVACEIHITDLDRDVDVHVVESFSQLVDITSQVRFHLDGINGNVDVRGDPTASVARIEGVKHVGSDTRRDAEAFLGRVRVEVDRLPSEIRVETIQPHDLDGRHVAVDYEIVLPVDIEVSIEIINGDIWVESFHREVDLTVTNGNVDILDVDRSVFVQVTNGNVDADVLLSPDGQVDIRTVNGNIDLDVPGGVSAELAADVTNGSVTVVIPGYPVVSGTTVRMTLGSGRGRIDLDTTNGNIRVNGD